MGMTLVWNSSVSVIVDYLDVDLFDKLFPCLLDGIVIDFHLFREVLLKPFVLVYLVPDEGKCHLSGYLYACLSVLAVVEPCLCPPAQTDLVRIDANCPWYIETLDCYIKVCKRINQTTVRYCFVVGFFFTSSFQEER